MAGFEQRILSFYGIDSLSQLDEDPDIIAYRAEVDMLELMDAGDAKIWLSSTVEEEAAPLDAGASWTSSSPRCSERRGALIGFAPQRDSG